MGLHIVNLQTIPVFRANRPERDVHASIGNETGIRVMARMMRNVLLVDDEPEICILISAVLRRSGSRCVFAHTLADGLRIVDSGTRFDAAFLDANLPDGPGYSLISRIKARSPGAVCVAISAMDTEGTNAKAAGADIFVPKPLGRRAILDSLRSKGFMT